MKINEIVTNFIEWCFNISAFILLPLIIYAIIYLALNKSIYDLFKLPEWMFIAIILYADTLCKALGFNIRVMNQLNIGAINQMLRCPQYAEQASKHVEQASKHMGKESQYAEQTSQFMVSWAILGVTISSVLLTFSIIAKYEEMEISSLIYKIQFYVFFIALASSLGFEFLIKYLSNKFFQ